MNVQNWNNSEYVTIGIALLSYVWRVAPPKKRVGRLIRSDFP